MASILSGVSALLLSAARQTFVTSIEKIASHPAESGSSRLVNKLTADLLSWLLIWRLTLGHWRHDVSSRLGKDSEQHQALAVALNDAYDRTQAVARIMSDWSMAAYKAFSATLNSRVDMFCGWPD